MLKGKAVTHTHTHGHTHTNVPAYLYSSRIKLFFRLKSLEDKGSGNSTNINFLSDQRPFQQLQINFWCHGKKSSSGDQNTKTQKYEM